MSQYTRISSLIEQLEKIQKDKGDLFVAVSMHPDFTSDDLPDVTDVTVAHDRGQTAEDIAVLHVGN